MAFAGSTAEVPTEKPTEAPTQKPTEPETEAPTQKPTQPETEAPTEKPSVSANKVVHNFTESGKTSSFYTITGNLSTSKGTVSYDGHKLTSTEKPSVSANKVVHNFTESGKTSSFYTITGNLSTSKGTVSYDGHKLTSCLKMESSTSVKFTAAEKGTLTLVFVEKNKEGAVKVDGKSYNSNANGIVEVAVSAGSHTIT